MPSENKRQRLAGGLALQRADLWQSSANNVVRTWNSSLAFALASEEKYRGAMGFSNRSHAGRSLIVAE